MVSQPIDSHRASEVWLRIEAFMSLKSPNTQKTYRGIIREWYRFLNVEEGSDKGAAKLLAANDLTAISYINHLSKQKGHAPRLKSLRSTESKRGKKEGLQHTLSNSTIAKKVAAIRRLYRVLVSANLGISSNPFDPDKVQVPKASSGQKRPTEMVDFEVVKEIVNSPAEDTPKGLRDRAILATLFSAGLRKSELINLRMGDVRRSQSGITFLRLRSTKSGKDSDQPLPDWAVAHLISWMSQRKEMGAADGDFVFTGFRGRGGSIATHEAISESGLHKLFKYYCKLAGASHYATPHSARATAITKLLSDGHDHKYVQKFSRHSSTQMVDVYDKRRLDIEDNPGLKLDY